MDEELQIKSNDVLLTINFATPAHKDLKQNCFRNFAMTALK